MDNISRPPIEEVFEIRITRDVNNSISISILDLLANPDSDNLLGWVNYPERDSSSVPTHVDSLEIALNEGIKKIEMRGYSKEEINTLLLNGLIRISRNN